MIHSTMKRTVVVGLLALIVAVPVTPSDGADRLEAARTTLARDSEIPVEISPGPSGTAGFVRARIPLSPWHATGRTAPEPEAAGLAAIARYAELFGVRDARGELRLRASTVDPLGMAHLRYEQMHRGVPVYGAAVSVHLSRDGRHVVALGNGFVPGIDVPSVESSIESGDAIDRALRALPAGSLVATPELKIFAGTSAKLGGPGTLAWFVDLHDPSLPARNVYVVDASDGAIVTVIERLCEARDRRTFDAGNLQVFPVVPVRTEFDPPVGDADVDAAHDFAGETYDYYDLTFGRDSYDDAGGTIRSVANFGVAFLNAFWDGVRLVYGDNMATRDIVAHEYTHGVIDHTATLQYVKESGALNESWADMMGVMVDRDDWELGEGSALGVIRDVSNPPAHGQPAHTDDWLQTCADNEGVHTNSGITNKAFYNIAVTLDKERAEQIVYRALALYLGATSSLEDSRAASLQAAEDLYGFGSAEYSAVNTAFAMVGLDGTWVAPASDCSACTIQVATADRSVFRDAAATADALPIFYRFRDEVLSRSITGSRYRRLYETHTPRIAWLMLRDASLRTAGARLLQTLAPGLEQAMDAGGPQHVVTRSVVVQFREFGRELAEADRARGGGALADVVEREVVQINPQRLIGMSYRAALRTIFGDSGSTQPDDGAGPWSNPRRPDERAARRP